MNLNSSLRSLALDMAASSVGAATRCIAANFRWEQAVSDARAEEYNTYVNAVTKHADWQAEHKGYVDSFVNVAKDHLSDAESFMSVNDQAHLNESMDNAILLRLESLGHLFEHSLVYDIANKFWQRFYNSQKDLRKNKLPDNSEALRTEFAKQWNKHRTKARPMFASFLNNFEGGNLEKLIKSDWPHILRDRLGLTHWPGSAGKPLSVALMSYTLDEVRQARAMTKKKGAIASFARPTVLDGEMSAAFMPAPLLSGGKSYGYTLDLANTGVPSVFSPELLTFPIEYEPRHIKALGFISRSHALQRDEDMLAARNRHVQGLRCLPDCDNFGEVLT